MAGKNKQYRNDKITVVWKPDLCIHSENCARGLPKVFDPERHPWVDVTAAESDAIMKTVDTCPSGALSYFKNSDTGSEPQQASSDVTISVMLNGPLIVEGSVSLLDGEGAAIPADSKRLALCRCGASENKPLCDGSHKKIEFKG